MATQRYVSTSFWDDEWIQNLAVNKKLLYMYLLTNPLTNIAGVYKITTRRMAFDTGISEKTLIKILDEFAEAGKAFHFAREWIILPNWPKHQHADKRAKIRAGINNILAELPKEVWNELFRIGYRYPFINEVIRQSYDMDSISIPYAYEPNYSDSDLDIDSDIDIDSDLDILSDKSDNCPSSDEPDDISESIAGEMVSIMKSVKPDCKTPSSLKSWAKSIDRIIRLDGKTPEQIIELFTWAQHDSFWTANIRSPDKLRAKWDQLEINMQRQNREKAGSQRNPTLEAINELYNKARREERYEEVGSGCAIGNDRLSLPFYEGSVTTDD